MWIFYLHCAIDFMSVLQNWKKFPYFEKNFTDNVFPMENNEDINWYFLK